jgi:hypothetical protein
VGPVRRGNLETMRKLAEEVKARARIGQDILGDQNAKKSRTESCRDNRSRRLGRDGRQVFLEVRELMTRKVRDGKPVTPTLRRRTHEQSERYLKTH